MATKSQSYLELKKQIEALHAQAEQVRQAEVDGVIQRIKDAIREYGLTAQDLGFGGRGGARAAGPAVGKKAGRKSAKRAGGAMYRDENGNTWGGRGPRPHWLRSALQSGKSLDDFRV
ncbi:MAG TPA: H-NS histone family protein [Burkholderiaceae bacterium]|nr:H-NS histone family protein [Burkholderiaceae bacterium]